MSVYMRAAKNIAMTDECLSEGKQWKACCGAIKHASRQWNTDGEREHELQQFIEVFKPRAKSADAFWWRDPWMTNADQQARVLALLFMHWMTTGATP